MNFVAKQDSKRFQRIKFLMRYCYRLGKRYGKIYENDAQTCCAIVIDSERKQNTLSDMYWDLKLAMKTVGLFRISEVMNREKILKTYFPNKPFLHLWYVGVDESSQGKGLGTAMVQKIIVDAQKEDKPVQLETSTVRNFAFYEKLGFDQLAEVSDFGYAIRIYRKESPVQLNSSD